MRSRARMGSLVLVSLGAAFFFLVTAMSFAGPDPGVISGTSITFSGNQSNGILSGVDFSCPPITTVNVWNLNSDITPSGSIGVGIGHLASDGGNGGWYTDGGNGASSFPTTQLTAFLAGYVGKHAISVEGVTAFALLAKSVGGDGGDGGPAYLGLWAGDGGDGGNGAQDVAIITDGWGPLLSRIIAA